jgi:hypothetical protein
MRQPITTEKIKYKSLKLIRKKKRLDIYRIKVRRLEMLQEAHNFIGKRW